jgi:hypothetical protein
MRLVYVRFIDASLKDSMLSLKSSIVTLAKLTDLVILNATDPTPEDAAVEVEVGKFEVFLPLKVRS